MLSKTQIFLLGALFAILLVNNWSMPLWDQDEAAYAGFGKTMIESGDYLIPDYYFSHDHRKTPLHFWDISWSFLLFGYNEFAVRFPSFLAIAGTLLLVLFQSRKWIGINAAFNATVVLGSSFLVTALAKISVTDGTLLFFSALSGFALLNCLEKPSFKWGFLFYFGLAMGLLTKGPPIIIFIGCFAFLLFVFHPQRFNLLKLHPWFFLPLAFAPIVWWGYLTTLRDGGTFLEWMYDWYVKRRVSGSVYGQEGPIGMHLALITGFFSLYLMYFFPALKIGITSFYQKNRNLMLFGAWLIAGWLIYEFSPSKLPAYVISAHVGIAILIGKIIDDFQNLNQRPKWWWLGFHYSINFALGIGLIGAKYFLPINGALAWGLTIIGIIFIFLLILQLFKLSSSHFFNLQFSTGIFFLLGLWTIAPLFSEHINSSQRVSEKVLSSISYDQPIVIGHAPGMQPSLPFYLSANNNPVFVELDNTKLLQLYDSIPQGAFVLNEDQDSLLKLTHAGYVSSVITSRIIDRKEQAKYYITIKK